MKHTKLELRQTLTGYYRSCCLAISAAASVSLESARE